MIVPYNVRYWEIHCIKQSMSKIDLISHEWISFDIHEFFSISQALEILVKKKK